MSARKPRFEVVRVDGGRFVRFVAANGRIVWGTPGLLSRRIDAFRAIELVTGYAVQPYHDGFEVHVGFGVDPENGLLEVRLVDERTAVTP